MSERRNTDDRRTADRRRSQRSPIDCQIRLLSAAAPSEILEGSLLNVSASGVKLVLSHPVASGEKLLVEARCGVRVLCSVTVQVIWSEPGSSGSHIVGCESVNTLSPRQLSQLKSAAVESASIATV
jgi:hypothetical protein